MSFFRAKKVVDDKIYPVHNFVQNIKTKGQTQCDQDEVAQYEPPHLDLHCLLSGHKF